MRSAVNNHNGAGVDLSQNTISDMQFIFGDGRADYVHLFGGQIENNVIQLGNGAGDVVSIGGGGQSGNSVTMGNGNGDSVTILAGGGGNHILLGDGNGDVVSVGGRGGGNDITVGDGSHVSVTALHNLVDANDDHISVGNGAFDTVTVGFHSTVVMGDGHDDQVILKGGGNTVTIGDGNRATVYSNFNWGVNNIALGNGNDTVHVGNSDTIKVVGIGHHDQFIFDQTTSGLGAVTITGFDVHRDVLTFTNEPAAAVAYHDNAAGDALITIAGNPGSIELVGVHSQQLHPSDFHFAPDLMV